MNNHEYLIQALHSAEFAVANLNRGLADATAVEANASLQDFKDIADPVGALVREIVLLSLIEKAETLRAAIDGFLTACDEA